MLNEQSYTVPNRGFKTLPVRIAIRNAIFTAHYARTTSNRAAFSQAVHFIRHWYPHRGNKALVVNRFSY